MKINASAPGNLMLMGEHAVLHGELAIACAVEQRIRVTLEPLESQVLRVSSALSNYQDDLRSLADDPQLRFVLQAVRSLTGQLPGGLHLKIDSEFSHRVGLGSSAAVTVAVTAALQQWVEDCYDRRQVFERALETVLAVQGRGSGTDLAASTYGAVIGYRVDPLEIIPLDAVPQIGLYYCGYKTPTPDVLARVAAEEQRFPELYKQLYQLMGAATKEALAAAAAQNWPLLGQLMNYYQGLMDALGVNDKTLADIVYRLRAGSAAATLDNSGVYGAKISGSGLGDCVISLGRPNGVDIPYDEIPVKVAPEGVKVDVQR